MAVKALSLRGSAGWKQIELFEREAKALQQLSHPSIPRYIEYFEADTSQDREFFLVQVGLLLARPACPYVPACATRHKTDGSCPPCIILQ